MEGEFYFRSTLFNFEFSHLEKVCFKFLSYLSTGRMTKQNNLLGMAQFSKIPRAFFTSKFCNLKTSGKFQSFSGFRLSNLSGFVGFRIFENVKTKILFSKGTRWWSACFGTFPEISLWGLPKLERISNAEMQKENLRFWNSSLKTKGLNGGEVES